MNLEFETIFPKIEKIEINGDIRKYALENVKNFSFSKSNIENIVSCGDLECRSGGVRIFDKIADVLAQDKTQDTIKLNCNGYQLISGQRKPCDNHFIIHIKVNG